MNCVKALALTGFALVLTGCVVAESPPYGPPPIQPPQACTFEYAPVCGVRRGQRDTYSNACMARAEGARILHQGECRAALPPREPAFCTREYRPVCAAWRGERRTFGNACEAEAAGFRIRHSGSC